MSETEITEQKLTDDGGGKSLDSITQDSAAPLRLEGQGGEGGVKRGDAVLTPVRDCYIRYGASHGCRCWYDPSRRPCSSCPPRSCLGVQLEIAVGPLPLDPAVALLLSDTVIWRNSML